MAVVTTDTSKIQEETQRANQALSYLNDFYTFYQAEKPAELPDLDTDILRNIVLDPLHIQVLYKATVSPVSVGGVPIREDALSRDEPSLEELIREANALSKRISQLKIPTNAFEVVGGTVVIPTAYTQQLTDQYTVEAVTAEELSLWQEIQDVKAAYDQLLQTAGMPNASRNPILSALGRYPIGQDMPTLYQQLLKRLS